MSGKDLDDKKNAFLKDPRQKRLDDINAKFLLGNNSLLNNTPEQNRNMPFSNQRDFNRPTMNNAEQNNGFSERVDTDWVVLTNLPAKISDRDIMDFFSDVGLVPCRLHLMPGNQTSSGSRSADGIRCFCRFEGGPDDVHRACSKDGMPLGMSRVTVTPVMQSVVENATGTKEAPPSVYLKPPPTMPQHSQSIQHQLGSFQSMSHMTGGQQSMQHNLSSQQSHAPPLMNINVSQPLNAPQSILGLNGPLMMMRGDGHMNMRRPPPMFPVRGGRGGRVGGFPVRGRGGQFNGGFPRNHGPNNGPPPSDDVGVDGFGAPGCVVSMENVPFRAGVEEILEFFRGFEIPRENIIRRFNDQGNPTGDAKVAFNSPQDAKRAVESRLARGPNCKIRDRRIYLTIT